MNGAALVAIAATIGNFLQGWDNAAIAGAVLYIKQDLNLESSAEGLLVAMSLIGATVVTTCSGAVSDFLGRRPMLISSSLLYFISGLIMLWSPNIYVLYVARLLDGFGIGLAVTLVPIYISETAPPDIRGLLNTLPQFTGSGGMFLAYCMIFGMSFASSPSWNVMLGVLVIPSLVYFLLAVFYLPESPRWLVSKGRMLDAKRVLQRLRGQDDVSAEMALLVEGLAVGGERVVEEYVPADAYGSSWVIKPGTDAPRQGSVASLAKSFVDPLVTLFGSLHEKVPGTGSMMFPNFGSMISTHGKQWVDDENPIRDDGGEYVSEAEGIDTDDELRSPLMSRQTTSLEKDMVGPMFHGSVMSIGRHGSTMQGGDAVGIGGGWQLAYKWNESDGGDSGFRRVYLRQDGVSGSVVSLPGEFIQASAVASHPAMYLTDQKPVGPAMVHPAETASKGPMWAALGDPGVKRALIVGVGIQILQQFSGINGVLYYTPQILESAGADVILSNLGLTSTSSSFLISAFTTFLMLPCIALAMRLMDVAGRRSLLLATIPVLMVALVILIVGKVAHLGDVLSACLSTVSVIVYFCAFVSAFGPIPNILCSEIFPTKIRGLCIAICALVFWISDVIVTYSLPVMLSSIGLAGACAVYLVVCTMSFVFVYHRVPETKGMPLEVITEFFAVGAK